MNRVAIIGGGISGLAVLHYIKQRFGDTIETTLFERDSKVGGTIRSLKKDACLFEWGPNGFLDNQPASLQLIEELGLSDQLIEAGQQSARRYIQVNGQLQVIPASPIDFIQTPLLPTKDKWSLIKGFFKKNISTDCSIYDYVSQRFSSGIAESVVDPFISGIYAGDIKRLHMAAAFPKFKRNGNKKSRMCSFKGGMGQIIEALDSRYKQYIKKNSEVDMNSPLFFTKRGIGGVELKEIVILATPAYAAVLIIKNSNPVLAKFLAEIPYAPVAVVGLLFNEDSFKKKPDGFGYLIPSKEEKDILGVLIESNVYAGRSGKGQVLVRVLLGGAHHPEIINDGEGDLIAKATKEINNIYGLVSHPVETIVKAWPKAIPQYELNYPHWRQSVAQECAKTPGLYLCANYLDGISFNDCVKNAKSLVDTLSI